MCAQWKGFGAKDVMTRISRNLESLRLNSVKSIVSSLASRFSSPRARVASPGVCTALGTSVPKDDVVVVALVNRR